MNKITWLVIFLGIVSAFFIPTHASAWPGAPKIIKGDRDFCGSPSGGVLVKTRGKVNRVYIDGRLAKPHMGISRSVWVLYNPRTFKKAVRGQRILVKAIGVRGLKDAKRIYFPCYPVG